MITPITEFSISETDAARAKALGDNRIAPGIRLALQRPPVASTVVDDSPTHRIRIRWTTADAALADRWAAALALPDRRGAAVRAALRAALAEPVDQPRVEAVRTERFKVYDVVAESVRDRFGCSDRAARDWVWMALQRGWLTGELPASTSGE